MTDELRMAQLMVTRLCHDLAGPVNALNNGAELLEDDPDVASGEALSLLLDSAKESMARLQFYRLSYGRVAEDETTSLADYRELMDEFFQTGRTSLSWADDAALPISQAILRIVLNLLIVASQALVRRGEIILSQAGTADSPSITLTLKGPDIRLKPEAMELLQGAESPGDAEDPKTAQLHFLAHLVSRAGMRLTIEQGALDEMTMKLHQP